jgi:predicted AlkP superfamily pyrophosphatase or phosphodiesterase
LQLPEDERPHFITLYFHETDSQGHDFGPNSAQTDSAIALLDRNFGTLLTKLNALQIKHLINIIIVSDHGMTTVSAENIINLDDIVPAGTYESWESGPMMMIDPANEQVYQALKENQNHFRVYRKNDMPPHLNFSKHPFIYPLLLLADPGYTLAAGSSLQRIKRNPYAGNHGYDNQFLDMHGIMIAGGPHFMRAYRTGTLHNIDIYPLICKIFDVHPAPGIDGDIDRISFILR